MATVFTRILNGELPGRFVWRDDRCGAFLSINPLKPGHSLVVPIDEVADWLDLEPQLNSHLLGVAQAVGQAQREIWSPEKVGLMLAGLEVPHVHYHVVPIWGAHDLDFSGADPAPAADALDEAAERIREALRRGGHGVHVPE